MRYCTQCGNQLGEGHRFCRACGHDMHLTNPPPPPPTNTEVAPTIDTADSEERLPTETAADRERARAAERAGTASARPEERAAVATSGPHAQSADDAPSDPEAAPAGRRVAKLVRIDDDDPSDDPSADSDDLGVDDALPDLATEESPTVVTLGGPADVATLTVEHNVPQLQIARMPLCPYCLDHLTHGVLACRSCSTEYHEHCWRSFRGCVHAGCDEWRLRSPA